jgi:PKD repeat protein
MRLTRRIALPTLLPFILLAGCGGANSSPNTPATQPPVANAGGPYTGAAGTAITFNGAASTDPQGQTLAYAWNFGDNSSTATGVSPTHTYAQPGTYTVSLTVTDTSSLTNTSASKANIAAPPDAAITGIVSSGSQPIAGAHVYLLAANTTGYGQSSVSLLNATQTGASDSLGAYVLTGSSGAFSLTGDYGCTSSQQLYLYALGGNAGSGINSAIGLLAAIGTCQAASAPAISVTINEVTTIAAAYALASFATDATHVSSSGTALAQIGVANAFATAPNLASPTTGLALATTPSGIGMAPQSAVNIQANLLAACVNAATSCPTLFAAATSDGTIAGIKPTDTASAAINIAHHPASNWSVFDPIVSANNTYLPTNGFGAYNHGMMLIYSGSNISPLGNIAIDGSGSVWFPNTINSFIPGSNNNLTEISNSGSLLSGANGYSGGSIDGPVDVALDPSNNAWVLNNGNSTVSVVSPSGSLLSGTSGYSGGGLQSPSRIAIDGSGNVWIANYYTSITELSSSGAPASGSPFTGGGLSVPRAIAIDATGDVWAANSAGNSVTELSKSGVILSGANGYTNANLIQPSGIAIDGSGSVWLSDLFSASVTEISNSNVASYGLPLADPEGLAIDGSGNVWVSVLNAVIELSNNGRVISENSYQDRSGYLVSGEGIAVDGAGNVWMACPTYLVEFVGAATPVVTPISVGVKNNTLGTRP